MLKCVLNLNLHIYLPHHKSKILRITPTVELLDLRNSLELRNSLDVSILHDKLNSIKYMKLII